MVGSAMVSLPWAYQTAGLGFGCFISLTSFLVSFYTCALIMRTAKHDKDYIFTLKKYYGNPGYYMGLVGPTILIFGAITVYFVVITQSLYPLLVVLLKEVFKMDINFVNPNREPYYHFSEFSCSYVAIFQYFLLVFISSRRDLSVFMRLGSLGAICVSTLIVFVISYGFIALSNTKHVVNGGPTVKNDQGLLWEKKEAETVDILMFNFGFSNLAGVLCAGYYLH